MRPSRPLPDDGREIDARLFGSRARRWRSHHAAGRALGWLRAAVRSRGSQICLVTLGAGTDARRICAVARFAVGWLASDALRMFRDGAVPLPSPVSSTINSAPTAI